jgi:hypothetical protein
LLLVCCLLVAVGAWLVAAGGWWMMKQQRDHEAAMRWLNQKTGMNWVMLCLSCAGGRRTQESYIYELSRESCVT